MAKPDSTSHSNSHNGNKIIVAFMHKPRKHILPSRKNFQP